MKDIKAGDQVLSRSDETGEQGYKKVAQTFISKQKKLYHLKYRPLKARDRAKGSADRRSTTNKSSKSDSEDGDGDSDGDSDSDDDPDPDSGEHEDSEKAGQNLKEIVGSHEHPFWSVTRNKWVPMKDLEEGEILSLADGSTAVIESLVVQEAEEGEEFTTYNFEVEDFHTYFVLPKDSDEGQIDKAVWVHNICSGDMQGILDDVFRERISRIDAKGGSAMTAKRWDKAWNSPYSVTKFQTGSGDIKYVVTSVEKKIPGDVADLFRDRISGHSAFESGAEIIVSPKKVPRSTAMRPATHHAEAAGLEYGLGKNWTLDYQVATHRMCPGCRAEFRMIARQYQGITASGDDLLRRNRTGFAGSQIDYGRNEWSAGAGRQLNDSGINSFLDSIQFEDPKYYNAYSRQGFSVDPPN